MFCKVIVINNLRDVNGDSVQPIVSVLNLIGGSPYCSTRGFPGTYASVESSDNRQPNNFSLGTFKTFNVTNCSENLQKIRNDKGTGE